MAGSTARAVRAGRALSAVALLVAASAWGVVAATPAAAATPHLTSTALRCPSTVTYGVEATCTVLVKDISLVGKKTPTGTVAVDTLFDDLKVRGNPCTLEAVNGSSSTCSVTVTPLVVGDIVPGALYTPSGSFLPSPAADPMVSEPAPLTVTAADASSTYGSALPDFTVDYAGFVLDDGPSDLDGTLSCETTAIDSSPVDEYPITCDGLSSSLYDITWVEGTLAISPAALTVTADDASRAYGGANPELTASYAGFVLDEGPADLSGVLACSTEAGPTQPVGSAAIACTGLTSSNYDIAWIDGALSVTPAALTVTADDAARVVGQPNPPFAVDYAGFVAGDTSSDLAGVLSCGTAADLGSPVGGYAIACGGLSSPNYDIAWIDGTLEVLAVPAVALADGTTLVAGGDAMVDTDGWMPLSTVTLSVCGVRVGTGTADDNGVVHQKVSLPGDLPVGACDLVVDGIDAAGGPYAVVMGVTLSRPASTGPAAAVAEAVTGVVTNVATGTLPYTGTPVLALVLTGLTALVGGAALTTVQRRRAVVRAGRSRR